MSPDDREALFAAILAAPEDDLPRLVFADFLEEQGHPALAARAAFIRLQIESEKHPLHSPTQLKLTRQAVELRPQFQDEWDESFSDDRFAGCVVGYRRGFVDEIKIEAELAFRFITQCVAAAPIRVLRVLTLAQDRFSDYQNLLAKQRCLNRVRTLRVGPNLHNIPVPGVANTLRQTDLSGLRRLELFGNRLEDHWIIPFVREYPYFSLARAVVELDLSHNYLTDYSASTLAAASWPVPLQVLRLVGNRITPEGAALLRNRFGAAVQL